MSFEKAKTVCIIPARVGSTRLENKPLVDIAGKTLIRRVYENIAGIPLIDEVIVAADDESIVDAVKSFSGRVILTPKSLSSGTDRVAYVSQNIDADIIINVQCDEPFIRTEMIQTGITPFVDDKGVVMTSLKTRIHSQKELFDPNVVKVITGGNDKAIYFSRFPIPYLRDKYLRDKYLQDKFELTKDFNPVSLDMDKNVYYKHLGIYFFRPDFLQTFTNMPPSYLEKSEKLEQLRALENGYDIIVPTTEHDSIGVDTKEDLQKVRDILAGNDIK